MGKTKESVSSSDEADYGSEAGESMMEYGSEAGESMMESESGDASPRNVKRDVEMQNSDESSEAEAEEEIRRALKKAKA
jgi:hypothetical protein